MGLNTGKYGPRELKFRRKQGHRLPSDNYKWVTGISDFTLSVGLLICGLFKQRKR